MAIDQDLGFADDPGVLPDREQGVDPLLAGDEPELVQARRLRPQRPVLRDICEGIAAPEPERLVEHRGGDARVDDPDLPRVIQELVEAGRIQLRPIEPQPVAGGPAFDAVGAEQLPQVGDVRVDRAPRRLGRIVSPDLTHQDVGRDQLVGADDQMREDRALLPSAELHRLLRPIDLQRSEDPEPHPRSDRRSRSTLGSGLGDMLDDVAVIRSAGGIRPVDLYGSPCRLPHATEYRGSSPRVPGSRSVRGTPTGSYPGKPPARALMEP